MAETPHPVDVHVGQRIRARRILLGLSQEKLGHAVGLTFQQIQKYEKGANRVSASRLFQFAQTLCVPVSYFFDGFDDEGTPTTTRRVSKRAFRETAPHELSRRETLELVRAYYRIRDPNVRSSIVRLLNNLAPRKLGSAG